MNEQEFRTGVKGMTAVQFLRARMALNLTQKQMAEKLSVCSRTISRYENGKTPISGPVAALIKIYLSNKKE